MSAEKSSITYNCLCIKVTTATFAQPRSYFLTAQCIHKDSNIDDSINESKPKYRTAASKSTKTPTFNPNKPFLIRLPSDTELATALEEYKVVFEAYAVIAIERESHLANKSDGKKPKKEAKLMGESIVTLADKKQQLLNQEAIDDVITLEGVLKIEQTEKRVPVGQASIIMQLQQVTESVSRSNEASNRKKSLSSSLHTYTVKSPPLVQWPAIKHSNSIMIQINRWWGDDIDLWPESFVHVMHRVCGEVVTATHPKSELSFFLFLEVSYLQPCSQSKIFKFLRNAGTTVGYRRCTEHR